MLFPVFVSDNALSLVKKQARDKRKLQDIWTRGNFSSDGYDTGRSPRFRWKEKGSEVRDWKGKEAGGRGGGRVFWAEGSEEMKWRRNGRRKSFGNRRDSRIVPHSFLFILRSLRKRGTLLGYVYIPLLPLYSRRSACRENRRSREDSRICWSNWSGRP